MAERTLKQKRETRAYSPYGGGSGSGSDLASVWSHNGSDSKTGPLPPTYEVAVMGSHLQTEHTRFSFAQMQQLSKVVPDFSFGVTGISGTSAQSPIVIDSVRQTDLVDQVDAVPPKQSEQKKSRIAMRRPLRASDIAIKDNGSTAARTVIEHEQKMVKATKQLSPSIEEWAKNNYNSLLHAADMVKDFAAEISIFQIAQLIKYDDKGGLKLLLMNKSLAQSDMALNIKAVIDDGNIAKYTSAQAGGGVDGACEAGGMEYIPQWTCNELFQKAVIEQDYKSLSTIFQMIERGMKVNIDRYHNKIDTKVIRIMNCKPQILYFAEKFDTMKCKYLYNNIVRSIV
ncbi:MAG: hypothetical protein Faunusvirus20_17 [Faunusvirus sp.]|jgi:hypothetical protein|uniref:Uncharacterized protein n=1 Tax=Faunusvirus sp. TaxID=2487766 RepID=A0A3G4ZYY7_9VIRU|nr:MAG: hypothetical protein Faunusvirus20_17 [Faunusvirus sp.]